MPPQEPTKKFEFTGSAGSFFTMYVLAVLFLLIPIVGFVFSFNKQTSWMVGNIKVNGRQLAYKASFGEVFVLLLVGLLLTVLTLGIYTFWFVPKVYRFVADHTGYADEAPATTSLPTTPAQPLSNPNATPTPPAATIPPSTGSGPSSPPANLVQ